jgi:hypothetical protein
LLVQDNFKALENQLKDSNWRLQQLQTQYDHLASKSKGHGDDHKKSEEHVIVSEWSIIIF